MQQTLPWSPVFSWPVITLEVPWATLSQVQFGLKSFQGSSIMHSVTLPLLRRHMVIRSPLYLPIQWERLSDRVLSILINMCNGYFVLPASV